MIELYNSFRRKLSKPKQTFYFLMGFAAYIVFAPLALVPFHIGSILSFAAMGLATIALNKADSKEGLSSRGFSLNASEQLQLGISVVLGFGASIYGGWMFPLAVLGMSFVIGARYYQLILAKHLENQNEQLLERCKNISDSGLLGVVSGLWSGVEITALLAKGAQPGLLIQRQGDGFSLMPGYGENLSNKSKMFLLATLVAEYSRRVDLVKPKPETEASAQNEHFMTIVFKNMGKAFTDNQNIRARWQDIKKAPSLLNLPVRPFLSEVVNSIGEALDHWNKAIRLFMPLTVSADVTNKPYSAAYRVEKRERKVNALVEQLKQKLGALNQEAAASIESKRQQNHDKVVTWMKREAVNASELTYAPEEALNLLKREKAELRQQLKV